mgnify:CR=1 FL=1
MKLATIFNQKGERVSYVILKDDEVSGFRQDIAEEGERLTAAELNDDSLAVALQSCYEEQAFFLAACLFESVYESSVFIGPGDLSDGIYDAARLIYGARDAAKRMKLTEAVIENFFIDPLSECRKRTNGN